MWLRVARRRRARVARSPSSSPTTRWPRCVDALGAEPGDLLLLVADEWHTTCEVLGGLRNQLGRPPVSEGPYRYVWVVDFPMFVGRQRRRATRSRPTIPSPGRTPTTSRSSSPTRCRCGARPTTSCSTGGSSAPARSGSTSPSCSSGSSRSSASPPEEADRRFGFFLNPFRYGAPPHGGFAFGIDRLVAILAGEDNIREVIAFPKPQSGLDPMTGAPTAVADAQLAELGSAPSRRRPSLGALRATTLCSSMCTPKRALRPRPSRRLAARLRPRTLDEVVGQDHLLAPGAPLRQLIEADTLRSVILWGPPGTGKTTIAELIATHTKRAFERLSAR